MTSAQGHLQLLGINLAGAEFAADKLPGVSGTDYTYPTHAEIDYYASKGLNVIRLPFLWERLQLSQNGALNASELSRIDDVVGYATAKGVKVVLDPHDFGNYDGLPIGGAATPVTAFSDFWSKLAGHFATNPGVIFGLMNEPQQATAGDWLVDANAAISAIRKSGATSQEVLVPGTYYDGASNWTTSDNSSVIGAGVQDPSKNFAFEVHQYLDSDGSGTHAGVVSASVGVDRITAATQWAESTGNKLFLGEVGVGQDATSLAALDNMLTYMDQHADAWQGATYWAGGPWWGDFMYSIEPTGLGSADTVDKPQLAVLEKHLPAATTTVEPAAPKSPLATGVSATDPVVNVPTITPTVSGTDSTAGASPGETASTGGSVFVGLPSTGNADDQRADGTLETKTYNLDGSVYAAASVMTLPDGNIQVDYTGGSVFAALPYTGYADDVRPDGTLAAETFFERDGTTLAYGYGADGTTLETETLYANGAVELSKAFTTLANGDTQIAYAGPLFDANPVYAGYTDIVHNGQVLSETLINRDGTQTRESYDTSGTRVGETVYNPDGSVQVSKAFSTLANGDSVIDYTGGSVFNGLPYASYTDEYTSGAATKVVEAVANRDGTTSVQALAPNVALTGSAGPDSFVFGTSLGHDSVANFTVAGAAHDTLVLPSSDFANLAAAIAGTRQSGADTIITAANNDQITLTGVNAATLTAPANVADFRFV